MARIFYLLFIIVAIASGVVFAGKQAKETPKHDGGVGAFEDVGQKVSQVKSSEIKTTAKARFVDNIFDPPPIGAIKTAGWMQKQMEEDAAAGWMNTCQVQSLEGLWSTTPTVGTNYANYMKPGGPKAPFYQPYIDRQGCAVEGEYQAHWIENAVRLGWVGNIEEYRKLATKAVNDILASLDETGYIGVDKPEHRFNFGGIDGSYELWSYGESLNMLLLYYQATKDKKVLDAVIKAADLLAKHRGPYSESKASVGSIPTLPRAMADLYRYTGDKKYLGIGEAVLNEWLDTWGDSRLQLLGDKEEASIHSAGWGVTILSALELYRVNGDSALLEGMIQFHDKVMAQHYMPYGAPSVATPWENFAGKGPYVETEVCGTFWWVWWWIKMTELTGDVHYADYAEKGLFNALPGSRSKDGRVAAYFMSPNQLTASEVAAKTHYASRLYCECCQSNVPRLVPLYVENMIATGKDDALVVPFYGACTAKTTLTDGTKVTVKQNTEYPFEETIRLSLTLNKPEAGFPIRLRIPSWCKNASIKVNGQKLLREYPSAMWAHLDRQWKSGDVVELTLPMDIKVSNWEDKAVYVERGPLLYTLPVSYMKKTLDKWGGFDADLAKDAVWNYALVLDKNNPASSFTVKNNVVPAGSAAWQNPPVALEVKAVRIPDWNKFTPATPPEGAPYVNDAPLAPTLPEKPFATANQTEKIQLVPYGFTLLRMTYLPWIEDKK